MFIELLSKKRDEISRLNDKIMALEEELSLIDKINEDLVNEVARLTAGIEARDEARFVAESDGYDRQWRECYYCGALESDGCDNECFTKIHPIKEK